ncbi:hypothetical protein BpHYR1_041610 [Brachionus plicatilis]|uniref:Uncharacterized protein n=1 Tax=Brachionus plicatilis TaxID=10195 RepID=A0A3M7Q6I4_BRAPC|nr:hypothetical protein BpHYR1_041610 [Brachionus plicatilis]
MKPIRASIPIYFYAFLVKVIMIIIIFIGNKDFIYLMSLNIISALRFESLVSNFGLHLISTYFKSIFGLLTAQGFDFQHLSTGIKHKIKPYQSYTSSYTYQKFASGVDSLRQSSCLIVVYEMLMLDNISKYDDKVSQHVKREELLSSDLFLKYKIMNSS